jgi:hypothetical protein
MVSRVQEVEYHFNKHTGEFIEGRYAEEKPKYIRTIPYKWFVVAAQLPGQSLAVGIAIWFISGLVKNKSITLSSTFLCEIGISRYQKYRAIVALEKAGLIQVAGVNGKNPIVTLLDVKDGC